MILGHTVRINRNFVALSLRELHESSRTMFAVGQGSWWTFKLWANGLWFPLAEITCAELDYFTAIAQLVSASLLLTRPLIILVQVSHLDWLHSSLRPLINSLSLSFRHSSSRKSLHPGGVVVQNLFFGQKLSRPAKRKNALIFFG